MAPLRSAPRNKALKAPSTRSQFNDTSSKTHRTYNLSTHCEKSGTFSVDAQNPRQMDFHPTSSTLQASSIASSQTLYATSEVHASPGTSYTEPQWPEARVDGCAQREGLRGGYEAHKRLCARDIDPAVGRELSRFVRPTTTSSSIPAGDRARGHQFLFEAGSPPEDLNYSLRNFVVADLVEEPCVVYARLTMREGLAMAGYITALSRLRRGGAVVGSVLVGEE